MLIALLSILPLAGQLPLLVCGTSVSELEG